MAKFSPPLAHWYMRRKRRVGGLAEAGLPMLPPGDIFLTYGGQYLTLAGDFLTQDK